MAIFFNPVLLLICIIGIISWIRDIHEKKIQEQQRRIQEQQQIVLEQQQKLLKQSIKYNKLCLMSKDLQSHLNPIVLTCSSLNEFRMYNKAVALDIACREVYSQYRFLADNHFLDKLRTISALPYSDSEYVKGKEKEIYKIVYQVIHTPVEVTWSYTSPAGRNHYVESAYITVGDLQEYVQHRKEHKHNINSEQHRRERERQLLTPGLRYDILKRDNFRCQICGRTRLDGVTLEVDHKKPIARGGKTEPNNLWTLCRDCNRGKADKLL